mmetsp:Transcript_18004/g.28005  ORF Transcript_18004/g.28005 Transcript_18004/m.28005 type:complete len:413 (+) Transcript_18004:710-1948(+)
MPLSAIAALAFPCRSSFTRKQKSNLKNTRNKFPISISLMAASEAAGEMEEKSSSPLLPSEQQVAISQLRDFPESISPDYRPVPFFLRAFILGASAIVAAVMEADASGRFLPKSLLKFISRILVMALTTYAITQDLSFGPSRVTTDQLLESSSSLLPSNLSRLQSLVPTIQNTKVVTNLNNVVDDDITNHPLNVHYLQYDNENLDTTSTSSHTYSILHCSHGFGASSLSWLPSLSVLSQKLNAKVGLAHDAVGFGFTERPDVDDPARYSIAVSAGLGSTLVNQALQQNSAANVRENEQNNNSNNSLTTTVAGQNVALFGHSMGCASTLRMAIELAGSSNVDRIDVVLVSPAVFVGNDVSLASLEESSVAGNRENGVPRKRRRKKNSLLRNIVRFGRKAIIDAPLQYGLRRLVR